jgi:hypothetical protein
MAQNNNGAKKPDFAIDVDEVTKSDNYCGRK